MSLKLSDRVILTKVLHCSNQFVNNVYDVSDCQKC